MHCVFNADQTSKGDLQMEDKIRVMLTTEGTYPYHQGGVSTWCDQLVHNLTDIEYVVYSIIMNPFVTRKFNLPLTSSLITVPLWGTEEPSEHLTTPFSQVYIAKRQTNDQVVRREFLPLFLDLIEELVSTEKNAVRFGNTLTNMHEYFQEYDYKKSFKAEDTWEIYKKMLMAFSSEKSNQISEPNVWAMIQSMGWIYRFLIILNTPIPRVNVSHSAAAAFCGIPCVLAKIQHKTPFLLTEHGVYLREQYLSLSKRGYPSFLNTFLVRMINSITQLNYHFADQVSPVCNYNTRWEKNLGVKQEAIKVIYNGVNKEVFTPPPRSISNKFPTVITVARIDPVKDIVTLIRAADIVRSRIKDVRFIVYGSVAVPEYFAECQKLVQEKELQENFIFAGHTEDIPAAYRSGDVVALSSITEAFPYSVVEAMMTGKPVVATDVGGISEALGETGILIQPNKPEELAKEVIRLLENPQMRINLGEEARQRALNYFTIEKVLDAYLSSYKALAKGKDDLTKITDKIRVQRLRIERGYAFMSLGLWPEALIQLREAVEVAPDTPAVPAIITEIAKAYNNMGQFDKAFNELDKAEALFDVLNHQQIA